MRSIRAAWKGASTFIEYHPVPESGARVSAPSLSPRGLGLGQGASGGMWAFSLYGLGWKRVYGLCFSLSWPGFKQDVGSDDLPRVLPTRIILQF